MSGNRTPAAGWLVVGVGRHVDRFGLPALARARGSAAVALCGTDPVRTADLAERYGVGRRGSAVEDLLGDPGVTHVYVCSRNEQHERHVTLAAAAGKHVLCEKPLAQDPAAAHRAIAACAGYGVVLGTGFHLRHNAAHREARRLLAEGAIGRPLWVDVTYLHRLGHGDSPVRLAGSRQVTTASKGAMSGTGAHAVDLAQWLAGDRIVRLSATIAELDPTPAGPQRVVQVSATTRGGVLVTFAAGRATHPANGLTVVGEAGRLTVSDSIGNTGGGTLSLRSARGSSDTVFPPHDVYAAQFEAFTAATAGAADAGPFGASGDDGLSALRVAETVDRALSEPSAPQAVDPQAVDPPARLTRGTS
ncbi:Gfo/Idh/MocA family protein [Actinacidiphila sp. bgisy145]|uniref:Gfo/Idh/MocA family protein n=1 Tax=Actinacidiphila sp. bgisy145 TaxID=3413792 RepID=UPI003EB9585B